MGDIGKMHKGHDIENPQVTGSGEGDLHKRLHHADLLPGGSPDSLVADLTMTLYENYAATNQLLIESYRHEAARQRAEKELIQDLIADLLSGRYAPSDRAILQALHPDDRAIEARAAELLDFPNG